jgi:hypothetical protein
MTAPEAVSVIYFKDTGSSLGLPKVSVLQGVSDLPVKQTLPNGFLSTLSKPELANIVSLLASASSGGEANIGSFGSLVFMKNNDVTRTVLLRKWTSLQGTGGMLQLPSPDMSDAEVMVIVTKLIKAAPLATLVSIANTIGLAVDFFAPSRARGKTGGILKSKPATVLKAEILQFVIAPCSGSLMAERAAEGQRKVETGATVVQLQDFLMWLSVDRIADDDGVPIMMGELLQMYNRQNFHKKSFDPLKQCLINELCEMLPVLPTVSPSSAIAEAAQLTAQERAADVSALLRRDLAGCRNDKEKARVTAEHKSASKQRGLLQDMRDTVTRIIFHLVPRQMELAEESAIKRLPVLRQRVSNEAGDDIFIDSDSDGQAGVPKDEPAKDSTRLFVLRGCVVVLLACSIHSLTFSLL